MVVLPLNYSVFLLFLLVGRSFCAGVLKLLDGHNSFDKFLALVQTARERRRGEGREGGSAGTANHVVSMPGLQCDGEFDGLFQDGQLLPREQHVHHLCEIR